MKKIMILAVVAALVGLSLPQSVSAQTGSATQDDQETQATPNTQGTGSSSQGTGSNTQGTGSSADPYGTGSQGTGTQGTGTQSESHKKKTQGTGTDVQGTGTGSGSTGTGSMGTGTETEAASIYTEIKTTDLPSAVSSSIAEKYPEYKTEKVFRGKDGTYKVKLSKGDVKETVFFDLRGEAVKMQK